MKEDLIVSILMAMMPMLTEKQMDTLKTQLHIKMAAYNVERKSTELVPYDDSDMGVLKKFIEAKASSRKASGTLRNYHDHISNMIAGIGKRLDQIDEDDINTYLYRYQVERGVSKTTARNVRASLSSFFSWMRKTGRISKNPMDLVEPIRPDQTIKTS